MTPPPRETPGDRARRLVEEARKIEQRERQAIANRLDVLERRVDAGGGSGSAAVVQELRAISDRLDALEGAAAQGAESVVSAPFHWEDLEDPDERVRLWGELETWVDEVLIDRYLVQGRAVRDCWAQHPAAIDVLTAAWLAWLGAYRTPTARLAEPATWHRDVLGNLTKQLEAALEGCEHD